MKRKTIFLFVVALVALAVFATSCGHHRPHFRRSTDVLLSRIDRRVKLLNLTEEQQVQYEEIRDRFEQDLRRDLAELRDLRNHLSDELNSQDPDMEKITEMLKMSIPESRNRYIDYFVEFYNILDEEQKKKMTTHMNKRFRKIGRRTA